METLTNKWWGYEQTNNKEIHQSHGTDQYLSLKSGHQSTNDGCIEQLDEYVYQTYEICIDGDTMKKQSTNITYMRTGVQFAFLVGNSPQWSKVHDSKLEVLALMFGFLPVLVKPCSLQMKLLLEIRIREMHGIGRLWGRTQNIDPTWPGCENGGNQPQSYGHFVDLGKWCKMMINHHDNHWSSS